MDAQSALSVVTALQRVSRSGKLVVVTAGSLTFREYAILDRIQLISNKGTYLSYFYACYTDFGLIILSKFTFFTDPSFIFYFLSLFFSTFPVLLSILLFSAPLLFFLSACVCDVGTGSIFFGMGSSAVAYFARLGRTPRCVSTHMCTHVRI